MNKIKILINSQPRSAHAWLQFILNESINTNEYKNHISMGNTENEFIIRSNEPVMLRAKFEDVIQTGILRDPIDLIPSIITKALGGISNHTTSGVSMPIEFVVPPLKTMVDDQIFMYNNWIANMNYNMNNLHLITFEQATQDVEFCIKYLMGNFSYPQNNILNYSIPELMIKAKESIKEFGDHAEGVNNSIPVIKKPDIYYEAYDKINNHMNKTKIVDLYNFTKNNIIKKQMEKLS